MNNQPTLDTLQVQLDNVMEQKKALVIREDELTAARWRIDREINATREKYGPLIDEKNRLKDLIQAFGEVKPVDEIINGSEVKDEN